MIFEHLKKKKIIIILQEFDPFSLCIDGDKLCISTGGMIPWKLKVTVKLFQWFSP